MARVPLVRLDHPEISPEARAYLTTIENDFGQILNIMRVFANHPKVGEGFWSFATPVYVKNSLTPRLTELAYTTASVVNQCHY